MNRLFDPVQLAEAGMTLAIQCSVIPRTFTVLAGILAIASHACEVPAVYEAVEEWAYTLCPEDTKEVLCFLKNNEKVAQQDRSQKSQWN